MAVMPLLLHCTDQNENKSTIKYEILVEKK
jgi:hypothetical protein